MLEFRLKSYRAWLDMREPVWHNLKFSPIDYQAISYYSAPKKKPELKSLDDVDPARLTYRYWDGRHNNWDAGTRDAP